MSASIPFKNITMNNLFTLGSALAISAVMMAGCAASKGTKPAAGGSEQLYMYKWTLVELDGKAVPADSKAHLLFAPGQTTQVSGNAGCNRLTGGVALSGESGLKFLPLAVTRMACMEPTVEPQFLAALEKVNDWRISNKELRLYDDDKLLAKFRGDTVGSDATALNGTWELNYISGPRIAFEGLFPDKKPQLVFALPKLEVSGNTGCNTFSAPFTMDGQKINFGDGRSTMMACPGDGEAIFLKTLKQVNGYAISEGKVLNLLVGDIAVMRFEKK